MIEQIDVSSSIRCISLRPFDIFSTVISHWDMHIRERESVFHIEKFLMWPKIDIESSFISN